MYKRRQRTRNWAQKEKQYLLELIKVRRKEILTKANNGPNASEENRSPWNEIMQQMMNKFGCDFSGSTVKKLKTQWQNMKRIAREEILSNKGSKRSLSRQSLGVCEILSLEGLNFLDDTSPYPNENHDVNIQNKSDAMDEPFIKLEKGEVEVDRDKDSRWSSSTESMSSTVLVIDDSNFNAEAEQSSLEEDMKAESEIGERALNASDRKYEADKHDETETKLRLKILNEELSTVKAIRETVELNKIIAEEKLRHLTFKIRCENR